MASPLYVEPADLDPQQRLALEGISNDDNICIVTGCAGCGKSALALLRLTSLCAETTGAHPALVTVARALTDNISKELPKPLQAYVNKFKFIKEWHNPVINTYKSAIEGRVIDKSTTHLMLDEYQDLSKHSLREIDELLSKCKQTCFFGDYDQQIYMGEKHEMDPISAQDIEKYYKNKGRNIQTFELNYNYRVPQNVARFVDAIRHTFTNNCTENDLTNKCTSENGSKPYLLHFNTTEDMLNTICSVANNRKNINDSYRAAIFTHTNETCRDICQTLHVKGRWSCRCGSGRNEWSVTPSSQPLIPSTVHKSKGCQFDDVFIYLNDILDNIKDEDQRFKVLHVAMTRPEKGLFLMYTGPRPEIFDQIPEDLFLEHLDNGQKTTPTHNKEKKSLNINNLFDLDF